MDDDDLELRIEALAVLQRLDAQGLNRGSTGNLSLRAHAGGFWITPTGMPADELGVADFVRLADDGRVLEGDWEPSSEWPFHRAIYRVRPDLGAVVHMHSPHATALACLRRPLPAFHYMVAVAGGDDVPCTPYHLFGTEALSQAVGVALAARQACLMANHGLVAGGATLAQALKVALEVEALCGIYLQALAVGEPALLSPAQMAEVAERFRTYGRARRSG
ncbi:MAG: fuculose phosphate aldolase [Rubrivivax sp. SCN 70-15]|nr:MAG: fuculose phosphate aldolase [Rubrivivax sp. SCN 70-15]